MFCIFGAQKTLTALDLLEAESFLTQEELGEVNRFYYLDIYIPLEFCTSDLVFLPYITFDLVFCEIRLLVKTSACTARVNSILLMNTET